MWYLEQVLDVLSFCVYKADVMYKFKESSAVLELLCPHTDVFCIVIDALTTITSFRWTCILIRL